MPTCHKGVAFWNQPTEQCSAWCMCRGTTINLRSDQTIETHFNWSKPMVGWMFLICICVEKWRWCLEIRDLQNPMDMFELKAQPHGFAYTYRAKYRHCDMHENPRDVSPSLFVVLLQCCLKQQLHMHLFVPACCGIHMCFEYSEIVRLKFVQLRSGR